ncbi:MAG TPA: hypothetical protein VMB73_35975 [Acetobacteraceae bacterium]|nr:hypothetical protein [Acetobacteraceae bacterium]
MPIPDLPCVDPPGLRHTAIIHHLVELRGAYADVLRRSFTAKATW